MHSDGIAAAAWRWSLRPLLSPPTLRSTRRWSKTFTGAAYNVICGRKTAASERSDGGALPVFLSALARRGRCHAHLGFTSLSWTGGEISKQEREGSLWSWICPRPRSLRAPLISSDRATRLSGTFTGLRGRRRTLRRELSLPEVRLNGPSERNEEPRTGSWMASSVCFERSSSVMILASNEATIWCLCRG